MKHLVKIVQVPGTNKVEVASIGKLTACGDAVVITNSRGVSIRSKDVLVGYSIISEEEYINFRTIFKRTHPERKRVTRKGNRIEKFNPRMKYSVLLGETLFIEGYSERSNAELVNFIDGHRGKAFRVYDADGSEIAILSAELTSRATFLFYKISK